MLISPYIFAIGDEGGFENYPYSSSTNLGIIGTFDVDWLDTQSSS